MNTKTTLYAAFATLFFAPMIVYAQAADTLDDPIAIEAPPSALPDQATVAEAVAGAPETDNTAVESLGDRAVDLINKAASVVNGSGTENNTLDEPAAATQSVAAAEDKPKQLSMGTYEYSVMYNQKDIEGLRRVLDFYENQKEDAEAKVVDTPTEVPTDELTEILGSAKNTLANVIQEEVQKVTEEPKKEIRPLRNFPDYYLGTILYENPKEWAFWLDGRRVTPRTKLGELRVLSVESDRVRFAFKPREDFEQLKRIWDKRQEMIADGSIKKLPGSHRFVSATPKFVMDTEGERVLFSLRTHQTAILTIMQVADGKVYRSYASIIATPEEEAVSNAVSKSADASANGGGAAQNQPLSSESGLALPAQGPIDMDRQLADKMIGNIKKIQDILPVGGGGDGMSNTPEITPPPPAVAAPVTRVNAGPASGRDFKTWMPR